LPNHSIPQTDPPDEPAKSRRFAVIVGGMKCGTTSLFEILKQHPELCGIAEKDQDFFTSDAAEDHPGAYLEQWPEASTGRVLLDASVSYTKAPLVAGVPERILGSGLGEWRFIYMVREPVSRIESQIRHGLYAGWGKSADDGLTDDLIHFSRYAYQLDVWTGVFSREDIHVVVLDEFEAHPAAVLRNVCEFVGVDPQFEFDSPRTRYNEGAFFESSKLVRAAATNPGVRRVVKALIPRGIVTRVRRMLAQRAASATGADRPSLGRWKLTPEEAERVRDHLRPDILRLHQHYGVEIDRWWAEWDLNPDRSDGSSTT